MKDKTSKASNTLIDRDQFARRLRALRKEKGYTQLEAAEKLGIRRTSISSWENGSRFPDIAHVQLLSRLYCVPMDYLYGTTEHRYNIKVPDYLELDLFKLNDLGVLKLKEYYDMLLEIDKYRNQP